MSEIPLSEVNSTKPTQVLQAVIAELVKIQGVQAIALGGSRARGTNRVDSDIDIGVYYAPTCPPKFDALISAAEKLADDGDLIGFGTYGEWGPWINGGIWLKIQGFKVDILLRDLMRVENVVRSVQRGDFVFAYQAGHPHAFSSIIYAGEIFHNIPLYDSGDLIRLRKFVDPYPAALAESVWKQCMWEATFSLENAASAAEAGDLVQLTGLIYRAISCMTNAVFALNGRYLLNEKGSLSEASSMTYCLRDYRSRVEQALSLASSGAPSRSQAIASLSEIHRELTSLKTQKSSRK